MGGWLAGKELIIRLTQSSWAGARTELGKKTLLKKSNPAERKKERREKMPLIVDT